MIPLLSALSIIYDEYIHSCHPPKDTIHSPLLSATKHSLDPLPNVGTFGANTNVGTLLNMERERTQERSIQAGKFEKEFLRKSPARHKQSSVANNKDDADDNGDNLRGVWDDKEDVDS